MADFLQGDGASLAAMLCGVLMLVGIWFIEPLRRFLLAFTANGALGLGALFLASRFGGAIGLHLGMNALTALTAFLLGLPGAALLTLASCIVT